MLTSFKRRYPPKALACNENGVKGPFFILSCFKLKVTEKIDLELTCKLGILK